MLKNMRFTAIMLVAIIALGLTPLFEKLAVSGEASLPTVVLTINLLTVALLTIPAWRHRPEQIRASWKSLLLVGGLASGVVVYLNIWALETTTATHRSVFQAMYPAMTAIFAYWLIDERLPLSGYLVIAAMTGGVLLMSAGGIQFQMVEGDGLLLLTLPMMGLCDAWAKKTLGTLSPQWVSFGRFFFGTLVLLPFLLTAEIGLSWPKGLDWLWIGLSAATIGLGINMLYLGMKMKGAALAAAMLSMSPILTLLIEWYWLSAEFHTTELFGIAIVLLGGYLLTRPAFQKLDH
ncbi:MAG: DMT family transporter [Gammaproteobacteria bacterium]